VTEPTVQHDVPADGQPGSTADAQPDSAADPQPGFAADAQHGFAADAPHGFAADAQRHRRDAPQHCPRCGASLAGGAGISVEFWQGADRIFHTWCADCRWTGDIIPTTEMIGHEPEHG
jgi:hypothetical protein